MALVQVELDSDSVSRVLDSVLWVEKMVGKGDPTYDEQLDSTSDTSLIKADKYFAPITWLAPQKKTCTKQFIKYSPVQNQLGQKADWL